MNRSDRDLSILGSLQETALPHAPRKEQSRCTAGPYAKVWSHKPPSTVGLPSAKDEERAFISPRILIIPNRGTCMTHVHKFVRPHAQKRRKLSETYRNGSSLGSLLLRRSRCNFINLCRQRHLVLRHRRVVQATQEKMLSTPHIGRK